MCPFSERAEVTGRKEGILVGWFTLTGGLGGILETYDENGFSTCLPQSQVSVDFFFFIIISFVGFFLSVSSLTKQLGENIRKCLLILQSEFCLLPVLQFKGMMT